MFYSRRLSSPILLLVILSSLFLLSACAGFKQTTLGYYAQGIGGHFSLMMAREPIDEVLLEADADLRQSLELSQGIREFATSTLSLPDNGSYTTYVALKDRYPIWNIFASESLSLKPKQWCYPIIGCANYRGYYNKSDAEIHAERLRLQGYDVMVGGASAYSTLGWFADPLTSAMLRRNGANLAELMFHELAHQQLFIKGDSGFNEAFASAVGEQAALLWLKQTQSEVLLAHYEQQLVVYGDFLRLITQARAALLEVYASDSGEQQKQLQKEQVFLKLRQDYESLKIQQWNNVGWYDNWFRQPINNARFIAIATYRDLVPAFVDLLAACNMDFARFYRRVEEISKTEGRELEVAC